MQAAAQSTNANILFFCDADIQGLSHQDITEIISPVIHGQYDMFIAMRSRPLFIYFPWLLRFLPLLGGERAVTRSLWEHIPNRYKHRFKIETALNFYSKHYGQKFGYKLFPHLTQTIKEKKYGFWNGLNARVKMTYQVFIAHLQVIWEHVTRQHPARPPVQ
jgi:hypothetical protein